MANTYVRMTKLNDVSGRSDYISNPEKQDYIYNHEKNCDFDWKEYQEFEKNNQKSASKNNEARELVIALPNKISELPSDERSKIAHSLAKKLIGENHDYEFALHFNKTQTNFHMHLIFSERERSETAEIKRYKRDMWYDKETNRMAKKNAPGAELRFKKGQAMKDKDGNYRYTDEPFTVKDKKFATKKWLHETHEKTRDVLSEYGYKLDIYDPKTEIKQQKLFKGAEPEYLEFAQTWNKSAKKINKETKEELTEVMSDRDSLQEKVENFDVPKFQRLRKNKSSNTIDDKIELKRLRKKFTAITTERDEIINKYDMPEEKDPKTVISRLNNRIVSIYDKFKAKKQELVEQLVTIKDQLVTESPKIASELKNIESKIEPSEEIKTSESVEDKPVNKGLHGEYWYDVAWNDDDTRYMISNNSIVAIDDGDAVALAFELTDEELEDYEIVPIKPLRKLDSNELDDLEIYQSRAKEQVNNNFYTNLQGETVYYDSIEDDEIER